MLSRVGVLMVCLSLIGVCATGYGEEKQPAPVRKAAPAWKPEIPPLTCNISTYDSTCELGKAPIVLVTVANWTHKDILLVGSLDGSSSKMRFPYCYFDVIGPDGKSANRGMGRCGNTSHLKEQDFVAIPASGRFNPHQQTKEHTFFQPRELRPEIFATEGEYRIRFIYSTESDESKAWNVSGPTEKLLELLKQVPKTTVCSNEITVKIVAPKKPLSN